MPETFPPAVGQLYDPTRPGLPEGMSWSLSTRGVELLMSWRNPSPVEVDAIERRTGPARFALIEQPNLLLMFHQRGQGEDQSRIHAVAAATPAQLGKTERKIHSRRLLTSPWLNPYEVSSLPPASLKPRHGHGAAWEPSNGTGPAMAATFAPPAG
ncbi:hypothetical protein [Streptomyces yangpuensis]